MRETLEEIGGTMKTALVELLDEAFGVFGTNFKSVAPMVRADYVYRLQATAYRRGLMMGMIVGGGLVGLLLLDRNLNYVYVQNKKLVEQYRIERRQQQIAERVPSVLAPQAK